MGKKVRVLGVDVGTQALKAAVYSIDGKREWVGSAGYSTNYPSPGLCEQNPRDWWNAFRKVLKECSRIIDLTSISAITVCATSSTVLVVNETGDPVYPALLWMDVRAAKEVDEINHNQNEHVQEILRYSGTKVSAEWMTPKSLWIKRNRLLLPNYKIVEQLDWFNFLLTGIWSVSQCNATCKWNYLQEYGFSSSFFDTISFQEYKEFWSSNVKAVGERVGTLTKDAANDMGLLEGIPVFQGGIDAHIGMLGIGATDSGEMSLIMGSSFVHLVHTEEPIFQPCLWGPYQNAILPDSWLIEGGQLTCGTLTTWFMEQFYHGLEKGKFNQVYDELIEESRKVAPGSNGLIILDSWQGNRTPYRNPSAKGNIYGLTLGHNRFDIYRAILESVAYGTRNILNCFNDSGVPIKRIIASGGGTKNPLWLQILSDVTGKTIEIAEEAEAGTKGCAVIAAYGLGFYSSLADASKNMTKMVGEYHSDFESHQEYEKSFKQYIHLNETILPLMESYQTL